MGRMMSFIYNRIHRGDGRVLLNNFFYLTLLKIAGYVFPLFTLPYLSKVIGVEGFGKIAFASAIIVWIETFTDWGFNYTATRKVAKCRDCIEEQSMIFSTVLWARLLLMIVSFVILSLLVFFVPIFWDNRCVIFATFLLVPGKILTPEWYFQAIEEMRYITYLNVSAKLVFTLAVFLFVKTSEDYVLQPLFISLGFIISGIISMWIVRRKGVRICKPQIHNITQAIKSSTSVFINNIMPNMYNNFSVMLLNFIYGPAVTGIYSAGKKFSTVATDFMEIVNRVFFPFLARKINYHAKYALYTMVMVVCASLMLFLLAPWVVRIFYTEEFNDAILVLKITSLAMPFVFMSGIYGTNYMILRGKDKLLMKMTIIASLSGFVLSFPLVYYYKYIGTAITFLISSFLMGILPFVYAKFIEKND